MKKNYIIVAVLLRLKDVEKSKDSHEKELLESTFEKTL